MTRKRTRESLLQTLTSPCPHCTGGGRVRATETLAYDALRRVQREAAGSEGGRVTVRLHPEGAGFLLEQSARAVEGLARLVKRTVIVEGDPALARDQVELSFGEQPAGARRAASPPGARARARRRARPRAAFPPGA